MNPIDRVGVAGAGAFGTALALVAQRAGRAVTLWGRGAERMTSIRETRENRTHLPGFALPGDIEITADLADLAGADMVLVAVPAQASRATAAALAGHVRQAIPVIACAKGIEQGSGLLLSEVLAASMPGAAVAALSGPGFAEEIAAGLPTAVTIASEDLDCADNVAAALSSEAFRPYASSDLVGVELGGALKNVLAIACGIVAGRGLGESARAALIARSLAEMIRIGVAMGARAETFMGLSGVGDLVLTATSERSRNTAFGLALGRGASHAELLRAGAPLVEGVLTAPVAADLAIRHQVDAPVISAVAGIVAGALTVDAAAAALLARPLQREIG